MSELVEEERFDIFVSYAEADRAWVEGYLLDALQEATVKYHSVESFRFGVPLIDEFERAIRQSVHTLLVCTHAFFAQNNERFVTVLAQHYGLESGVWPVIPLLLDDVPLPARLALLVPLDMRNPKRRDEALRRLCKELQSPFPIETPHPPCPYPGMIAFGEQDAVHFFGRKNEIASLLQRLRHHNFVAVIGPSGSGKSSLVFAGLLPQVRQSSQFTPNQWLVRSLRPGDQPLASLVQSLGSNSFADFDLQSLLLTQTGAKDLMLVIDQFEELFSAGSADAAEFVGALVNLLKQPNCYLIITVRADFYAELMTCALWAEIKEHRLEVTPLDVEGLHEAIERPAHSVLVYIESALVERLVNALVDQPGALPFLQEILVRLWDKLERRFLPLRAYESLVLPYRSLQGSELTGLQAALAQLADEMIAKLSPTKRTLAQRILVRLVEFSEGRSPTRRQQALAALHAANDPPKLFEETLEYLTNCRLITISTNKQGNVKVDLAHEAMIEGWPLLKGWVDAWKSAEQTRRRLEGKVAEWRRLGSQADQLFLGAALVEALAWMNGATVNDLGYSADLKEMLAQSQQLQLRQSADAKRRQRRMRLLQLLSLLVVLIIALIVANSVQNWWLNRTWRFVAEAPSGALRALMNSENRLVIGSYDAGVAWQKIDGSWSRWENQGLPTMIAAKTTNTVSNISEIVALTEDTSATGQYYGLVRDHGIYIYHSDSKALDGGHWNSVAGGVPLNTEANQPFAIHNGVLLYLGDDPGVHIAQVDATRNTVEWLRLADANLPPQSALESVIFDTEGTPYLGGEAGLWRGVGKFPWRWEPVGNFKSVTLLANSSDGLLYVVTQVESRAYMSCYQLQGGATMLTRPVPIANWFIYWLGVDKQPVHAIVGNPLKSGEFYMATSHGAVYSINCNGNIKKIAQKSIFISFSSLDTTIDSSGMLRLAWASQAGLYEWREGGQDGH